MNRKKLVRRAGTLLTVLMLITVSTIVTGTQATAPADPRVTTPKAFLGYDIGEQYQLTPWQTHQMPDGTVRTGIVEYAYELQRTSNRVRVFQEGTSEMGRPMILTVITAPNNWAQIDKLKGIQSKLADPRQVASDDEARYLASQGKAVYWISAAIHSTERTSPEVLLRLGYHLASGQDDWTRQLLDNVIVVLENTINPDGLDQVTDAYTVGLRPREISSTTTTTVTSRSRPGRVTAERAGPCRVAAHGIPRPAPDQRPALHVAGQ
jgi:hypothetical protein